MPMTLSELEKEIGDFNECAAALKKRRDALVEDIAAHGFGKRFAQKHLASVTVKMPEGKVKESGSRASGQ